MLNIRIIVPCYNSENFVEETFYKIKEVLAKIYFCKCHVYLIDDGSLDNTFSKLNELCAETDNFYTLTKENGGEGSARNYALNIDKELYDYVFFADSDDIVMTDFSLALSKLIKTKPDLLVCSYVQTDSLTQKVLKTYNQPDISYSKEKALEQFLYRNFVPGIGNTFFKKSEIRFSQFKLGADSLYAFENVCISNSISGNSNTVYNYKIRKGSAMDSQSFDNIFVVI